MSRHKRRCNLQEMSLEKWKKYIYSKKKTKNIFGQLLHGDGNVSTNAAYRAKYFNGCVSSQDIK